MGMIYDRLYAIRERCQSSIPCIRCPHGYYSEDKEVITCHLLVEHCEEHWLTPRCWPDEFIEYLAGLLGDEDYFVDVPADDDNSESDTDDGDDNDSEPVYPEKCACCAKRDDCEYLKNIMVDF